MLFRELPAQCRIVDWTKWVVNMCMMGVLCALFFFHVFFWFVSKMPGMSGL